jgi:(2Fe-2S) ferredoxin
MCRALRIRAEVPFCIVINDATWYTVVHANEIRSNLSCSYFVTTRNPNLRVERRVDFWRALKYGGRPELGAYDLDTVEIWIYVAKVLRARGMPAESFTLILHGPSQNDSQRLYDFVVGAAKIREAGYEIRRRQGDPLGLHGLHWFKGCYHEDLPQAVQEVIKGKVPARLRITFPRASFVLRNHLEGKMYGLPTQSK